MISAPPASARGTPAPPMDVELVTRQGALLSRVVQDFIETARAWTFDRIEEAPG